MGTDEPRTGQETTTQVKAPEPEHDHLSISEMDPLGPLPEEEPASGEEEDRGPHFGAGPIFGEGM